MALLILALLQRIFLMSSLMLLLVWLIFFMVLIKLLPILGTISGKTVKLMVLATALRSEERFSRNAETDLVCRLLLEKKKSAGNVQVTSHAPNRITLKTNSSSPSVLFFFVNDTATSHIYTLSLHDALPISSGVVDIFHGIDKAVADTWNNFWKDGKADGIGNSFKIGRAVQQECRDRSRMPSSA